MANILSSQSLAVVALSEIANLAKPVTMTDITQRYRHYASRMDEAMKARKLTNEGLGERIEAHPVTISKLRRNRMSLDDEWRIRVAAGINLPEDVLFGEEPLPAPRSYEIYVSPRKAAKTKAPRQSPTDLPLFGMAAGSAQGYHSMTSDPIDEVPCPPALRNVVGAYALKVRGQSMEPRFFNGTRLYINPHQAVRAGDDVIVQVRNHENSGTETWVKRYEGEDDNSIYVSQYNPAAKMEFRKRFVVHIHRVVPLEELFD